MLSHHRQQNAVFFKKAENGNKGYQFSSSLKGRPVRVKNKGPRGGL
jgi:hypothetical protein